MSKKKSTFKIGRDAENGQFIPVQEAQRRRKTAIVETIKKSSSTSKNKKSAKQ